MTNLEIAALLEELAEELRGGEPYPAHLCKYCQDSAHTDNCPVPRAMAAAKELRNPDYCPMCPDPDCPCHKSVGGWIGEHSTGKLDDDEDTGCVTCGGKGCPTCGGADEYPPVTPETAVFRAMEVCPTLCPTCGGRKNATFSHGVCMCGEKP